MTSATTARDERDAIADYMAILYLLAGLDEARDGRPFTKYPNQGSVEETHGRRALARYVRERIPDLIGQLLARAIDPTLEADASFPVPTIRTITFDKFRGRHPPAWARDQILVHFIRANLRQQDAAWHDWQRKPKATQDAIAKWLAVDVKKPRRPTLERAYQAAEDYFTDIGRSQIQKVWSAHRMEIEKPWPALRPRYSFRDLLSAARKLRAAARAPGPIEAASEGEGAAISAIEQRRSAKQPEAERRKARRVEARLLRRLRTPRRKKPGRRARH